MERRLLDYCIKLLAPSPSPVTHADMRSHLLTPPPTNPHTRAPSLDDRFKIATSPKLNLLTPLIHPIPPVNFVTPPLLLPPIVHSGDEASDSPASDSRADKRRRTKPPRGADPSPRKSGHAGSSASPAPGGLGPPSRRSQLAPIRPIGFAAAREQRRDGESGDQAIPSPVVMGFDFKQVDEDQLKTVCLHLLNAQGEKGQEPAEDLTEQVRDTISIREQQQALIAARRREVAASQPSTPKELTFKGWTPKEAKDQLGVVVGGGGFGSGSGSGSTLAPVSASGVGRRRDKTRDKVEQMSIVTTGIDKDVVPGSKVGLSELKAERADRNSLHR